jgi:long-chain acyl-CoA synthetase
MSRPFAWEAQYPAGVSWECAIPPHTLPEFVDAVTERFSERSAFEFRDHVISYAAFGGLVRAAAARFQAMGIGVGDTVALYLPNTPWHPICFFGALRAGARVVHLSPLDAPRMLARKLADADARVMVTTNLPPIFAGALHLLAEGAVETIIVGADESWGNSPAAVPIPDDKRLVVWRGEAWHGEVEFPRLKPDDVALLQYTGGTTGFPKAAMLSHGNLIAALCIYEQSAGLALRPLTPEDRVVGVLPLFHIYALTVVLLRTLSAGALILLRPRFDIEQALHDIEKKRATCFPGVPTMWIALTNHPGIEKRDLSSLTYVGSGGAPLPHEIRQRFNHLTGLRLGGGWGMTETSPAGTTMNPHRDYPAGAIGIPLPCIEIDVVDINNPRRVLAPGEVGELRVTGPNVFRGYWKREEETKAAFVDGRFLTGDLGYMDEMGDFFLVDRKKDMIISGGFNVYPRVIEDAVYEHPSVGECAVVGIADAYRGQAAKVFVVLKPGAPSFDLEQLKAFLHDKVARYEIPAALEIRAELPKTPVGKISRKELADEERARATPQAATHAANG